MSQRTLLIALAVAAVIALAGAAFFLGSDTFHLFGSEAGNAGAGGNRVVADDPFAESNDPTADIRFDGSDEHGRYIEGPNGEHIYIDNEGRRYVLGPDGKRIYVDPQGRRLGPDGKPIPGGGPGANGKSTPGGKDTKNGKAGDRTDDPDKKEGEEDQPDPADLTGSVVDDMDSPYPGATVTVQAPGGESRSTTSDDEGVFRFEKLPSETQLVITANDSYGNTSKPVNTRLAPGKTQLKQPLVLPRDTSIRGVVRSADTGLPIDGAQVVLLGSGDQFGRRYSVQSSQVTDAGGSFAFSMLTPAGYRIQISRDGFTPRILNNVEPPEDLVVEMSPGAVITGVVSDQGGNPITGARISCDFHAEPAQDFHTDTTSDETGYYAVKCQPESQHNTVSVIAPGYKSANQTLVKSGSEHVDFELAPSGNVVLRGRLLNQSGAPVLTATFFSYDAGGKYKKIVQSVGPDNEGKFWCEAVPEANQLLVRSAGLSEVRADYQPSPGGEVDLGDLYMDQGYALYGVVTKEGEPDTKIEGAVVTVGAASVESDKDGKYRIEGLSAEEFIVRVLHAAYLGTALRVTPTPGEYEIEQNIELTNADFEARLRIIDADSGVPIEGVSVQVIAYNQVLTTDAEGLVHLTGLSSMKIDVRIELEGYATVNTKIDADVSSKVSEAPPQEIALVKGDAIHGVCTTDGDPLPGATKVEIWNTSKLVATVYTDTEGNYNTESLPVGQYFVGLPDYHYAARPVELTEEGAEFDIEIGAVCHLKGVLRRADGKPHANAGIYVYRRDNVYWTATIHTDPEGRYEVSNLFPGKWVFCVLKTQGDSSAQFAVPVNVTEPGWNTMNVQLPEATGVMKGRVTYPDGSPVKKARVAVTNLSAEFPRALLAAYVVTDDDGYYIAERLENGMKMQARVGGYQDEAQTGTAFSDVVTMPVDSSPVEANIVVANEGVTVRVQMHRADGGPILSGGPLCYLYDSQGRLSGLYFGGGTFSGNIYLYDVVPGEYTLVVTNRGTKKAELQITVGTENIVNGIEISIELEDRSSG
ncbi:MAG: carboxypeptidase regulatory-like domain-containing protein [Planctomycetes bacterium]|nr:carboxypeptidase regulatory-like domain-containing protein [Planctomycetota bacterium]